MTARQVRVLSVALAAVVAVAVAGLVAALVVLPAVNRADPPPPVRPVVEAYLAAVADGDATAALAVSRADQERFDGASTGLLGDDVLQGARERITDPRVEAEDVRGTGATVAVGYTLAGERQQADLRLRYDEDAAEWHVVDGLLGTVRVEGLGGDTVPVEVAGVTPDPGAECTGECAETATYTLFAAVYDVRADLSGFEVHPRNTEPAEQLVTVGPGTTQSVRYLAVPQGDDWPVVNGNPTDPSPDATDG
ncbi:hypothetical protein [Cellulomonas shaoxiangyii]|uniref:DUF4878 domain-containing protein n=1 Tax=Cellulomonas shaoxiangyii TaxID=2566013 RepID=A0A4P7SG08_9CELL|nr:hypothetical protein [Cellulomonas shaoxiangyii]QCB92521.1 hypothetical protein E5225_02060 [Cellulomonas shaoxiangyii]TGY83388.1 hypothetical protein E5226_12200 [Cellulomonas shaoxiangyii]